MRRQQGARIDISPHGHNGGSTPTLNSAAREAGQLAPRLKQTQPRWPLTLTYRHDIYQCAIGNRRANFSDPGSTGLSVLRGSAHPGGCIRGGFKTLAKAAVLAEFVNEPTA
jgi:hypothetical protein